MIPKKISGVIFTATLLILAIGLSSITFATAITDYQSLPELTIKSDGSITVRQVLPPQEESQPPALLNRTGNTYTLTSDIEGYAVRIDCSNIVFDGKGHTIHASPAFINSGLRLIEVSNVTVKNLEVTGDRLESIYLSGSYCSITSVKTDALILNKGCNRVIESNITKLTLWEGNNNIILECTISGLFLMDWSSSNIFVQNNFLSNNSANGFEIYSSNSWDNGSVGNYWCDYLSKYPNASEAGNTGIGDTPYVIDKDNIDHFPLMYPYDIENDEMVFQTPEHQTQPLSTPLIAGASTVLVIGIIIGLFFYQRRKRKL